MQFLNQLVGGVSNMLGGAFQVVTSPLALIGDIGNCFGGQETNQWMGSQQGACCCGSGGYNQAGDYYHEATQNARIGQLERRLAYDEAIVGARMASRGIV